MTKTAGRGGDQMRTSDPRGRGSGRRAFRRSAPVRPATAEPRAPSRKQATSRAAKSEARRAAIVQAALDEFCARGFAATRIDDVAARAGVAKGTIYLYFDDKEALFQELVRTSLVPIVGALKIPDGAEMSVRVLLETFADTLVRE